MYSIINVFTSIFFNKKRKLGDKIIFSLQLNLTYYILLKDIKYFCIRKLSLNLETILIIELFTLWDWISMFH